MKKKTIQLTNTSNKQIDKFIDDIGRVIFTSDGIIDLLIDGKGINGLLVEKTDETVKYNKFSENDNLIFYTDDMIVESIEDFDEKATAVWKTPEEYQNIDIKTWILSRCNSEIERTRVIEELNRYEERDLYSLLKHLIYLVDHFRKNNIVWGVGRGSCCASYVLYLIGIHRVDSIKYDIDIKEFLK